MKPARYFVFKGINYYPAGGFYDLASSHADLEDAIEHANDLFDCSSGSWGHVLDTETMEIVHEERSK